MIRKIIYTSILFIALLYYFNKKGWINITPEGRQKVIHLIKEAFKIGSEFGEEVREEIDKNK